MDVRRARRLRHPVGCLADLLRRAGQGFEQLGHARLAGHGDIGQRAAMRLDHLDIVGQITGDRPEARFGRLRHFGQGDRLGRQFEAIGGQRLTDRADRAFQRRRFLAHVARGQCEAALLGAAAALADQPQDRDQHRTGQRERTQRGQRRGGQYRAGRDAPEQDGRRPQDRDQDRHDQRPARGRGLVRSTGAVSSSSQTPKGEDSAAGGDGRDFFGGGWTLWSCISASAFGMSDLS